MATVKKATITQVNNGEFVFDNDVLFEIKERMMNERIAPQQVNPEPTVTPAQKNTTRGSVRPSIMAESGPGIKVSTNPRSFGDSARKPDCNGFWVCIMFNRQTNTPISSFVFLLEDFEPRWMQERSGSPVPLDRLSDLFGVDGYTFFYLWG